MLRYTNIAAFIVVEIEIDKNIKNEKLKVISTKKKRKELTQLKLNILKHGLVLIRALFWLFEKNENKFSFIYSIYIYIVCKN